jgi:hypothetical protein
MLNREQLDQLQGRFTLDQLAKCAKREVGWRERVYPGRVEDGKMLRTQARDETEMMETIAAILRAMAEDEPAAAGRLL